MESLTAVASIKTFEKHPKNRAFSVIIGGVALETLE
jgi:hypothetical protein